MICSTEHYLSKDKKKDKVIYEVYLSSYLRYLN